MDDQSFRLGDHGRYPPHMILLSQMFDGMQYIPLIAFAMAIGVVVVAIIAGICLIRYLFPDRKNGGWTIVILVTTSIVGVRILLPTPVAESRVIDAAKPGTPIAELVGLIGEPHKKYLNEDGSGTLHYYADYIGHTGIGVIIKRDGAVDDVWVD